MGPDGGARGVGEEPDGEEVEAGGAGGGEEAGGEGGVEGEEGEVGEGSPRGAGSVEGCKNKTGHHVELERIKEEE